MWVRGRAVELASDEAWLRAMAEVEGALAAASATVGLIPASDAARIESVLGSLVLDTAEIAREASATGTPIMPLVERIRAAVGPAVAGSVHRGATSQDILDSATMLIARRALGAILDDLAGASEAAARLAAVHRATPIAGRTLLQQATPTTFGLKAANWMLGFDRAADRLEEIRRAGLAVQVGGVAGTRAGYDGHGQRLAEEMAERLGLSVPVAPWHTERTRIGDLASGLGVAAGTIAKAARDIVLLAQTEVAEVEEGVPGRGASSALPDKHNPVAAISALACAQRSFGLVATLFAAMVQEHERAAGNWQAEWVPLRQLLVTVDSAAAWLRDSLEHLLVRPAAMARNLGGDATPDLGDALGLVDAALRAHQARAAR